MSPVSASAVVDAPEYTSAAPAITAHIRRATTADVPAILALIDANLAAGHLLPRTDDDVTRRATRFLVVDTGDAVVGCAELAPLSRAVAEVRSLVVDESCRGRGFGSHLVEELQRWARQDGFSIVPHQWLPEKIATDCVGCPRFRRCAQYAMALPLRGRSLRPTPAGQRPYLALPPNTPTILPGMGSVDSPLAGRTLLPMAMASPSVS